MSEIPMYPDELDVAPLADVVRAVRRDLTDAAYRKPLQDWPRDTCVCGMLAHSCDTTCDPLDLQRCAGPAIRAAIRKLSEALL